MLTKTEPAVEARRFVFEKLRAGDSTGIESGSGHTGFDEASQASFVHRHKIALGAAMFKAGSEAIPVFRRCLPYTRENKIIE
jgi:hypothetical protein